MVAYPRMEKRQFSLKKKFFNMSMLTYMFYAFLALKMTVGFMGFGHKAAWFAERLENSHFPTVQFLLTNAVQFFSSFSVYLRVNHSEFWPKCKNWRRRQKVCCNRNFPLANSRKMNFFCSNTCWRRLAAGLLFQQRPLLFRQNYILK